jgi:hypothetical protein
LPKKGAGKFSGPFFPARFRPNQTQNTARNRSEWLCHPKFRTGSLASGRAFETGYLNYSGGEKIPDNLRPQIAIGQPADGFNGKSG